jgi:NitT/TauT family transport system permease protein
VVSTAVLIAAVVALWQVGSTLGWWNPGLVPAPLSVARELAALVTTGEFWASLWQTVFAIVASFALGSSVGLLTGVLFWRAPLVGRVLEPYVVSVYAVPLVVFYPIMLVVFGINPWSLILLASVVVAIPVLLNTWIGLEGVPAVYFKLGASLECTPRQVFLRIALPAAVPQIFAGLRIASVFAIIAIVAMEFLLAPGGLGFHVRYEYHAFRQPSMFAYIVAVFAIAIAFSTLVRLSEARLLGHRDDR